MRAHSIEPTLSWPTEGRRRAERPVHAGWSSRDVAVAEQPLARVAALLLSIAQNNSYEGRDPGYVPDALSSGFVADLLGVDVATLAALLVDLKQRGLVEAGPGSALQLKDIAGLEQLLN
jgi:hypothetical protein